MAQQPDGVYASGALCSPEVVGYMPSVATVHCLIASVLLPSCCADVINACYEGGAGYFSSVHAHSMGSAGDTAPDAVFTTPVKAAHFAMSLRSSGFYYNGSIWRMIAGPFDASAAAPAPAPAPAAAIQALPYDAELLDGSSSGDSDASGGGTTAASRRLRQQGDADAEGGVDLSLSPPDMPVGPPAAAARTRLGLWLTTTL